MNKMITVIVASSTMAFATLGANADGYVSGPSCMKPTKPYEFTEQWEVDSYNSEVRMYQSCIQEFVEEQNDAIRNHQNAAEEAIDEWNSFVNYGI